ncbi:uncharacterized protein F5147DRAFT_675158 [Suillus discolor]|uniref:DUF6534 domain-containing protein n=1 Tax=Suillus discolor TaxID=1912936 RepID=A0A9P7FFR1_9AGAM|nr:uncharacterized protein F5147DRAFT_675158 [Suillus discolor]KAG2115907.1 hypothetical protein F5147DRAFT_675158 [Suillus discolor]
MDATNSSTSLSFEVAAFNPSIIVGPVVLGALVDTCLFGCLVIQTYVYYANFANDHRAIRFTVAAVFAIQVAHVMCVSATLWNTAVSAYDDPSKLQILPLASAATILFTGITGALVESYFAFRLWKVSKKLLLPILSLVLCIIAQVVSIVITVQAFKTTSIAVFEVDQNTPITLALTSRVLCDLILTLSTAWYLKNQRSGYLRTTNMIDRLVLWTIETGLITSLVAVLVISFFLAMKETYIWVGLYTILASVNGNSLLALLNGRLIFRSVTSENLHMSTLSGSGGGRNKQNPFVINATQTVRGPPEVFKCDKWEV